MDKLITSNACCGPNKRPKRRQKNNFRTPISNLFGHCSAPDFFNQ